MRDSGMAHPLVIDGRIIKNGLADINKTDSWIISHINSMGVELNDVFLFTLDDSGNEYIIKKDKKDRKKGD